MFACARIAKHESQGTLILIYVSQTSTEMEQSGIEVGVRAIRKWWESACKENRPFVISAGSQSPSGYSLRQDCRGAQ